MLGEDIKLLKNVRSPMECNAMCTGETECELWTHTSGKCFLKNNSVFTIKNPSVTSGMRYCNSSGNGLQFWLSCFIVSEIFQVKMDLHLF